MADKVMKIDTKLHWLITNPKAIPTAGGCSVSVTTMAKEVSATHSALKTSIDSEEWPTKHSSSYIRIPITLPTIYPPIRFLGFAA